MKFVFSLTQDIIKSGLPFSLLVILLVHLSNRVVLIVNKTKQNRLKVKSYKP